MLVTLTMSRPLQLVPLLVTAAALAACDRQQKAPPANETMATEAERDVDEAPALPSVEQPLNRRDLLLAAAEAASNHALGTDDSTDQQKLDGQPFSFRMRLCEGAANVTRSFDADSQVLRIMVRPDLTQAALPLQPGGKVPQVEAAEGFWVPQPWLLRAGCPQLARTQAPLARGEAEAGRTIGLAQFFTSDEARSSRRETRPYQVTRELPTEQAAGPVDLVLNGRLRQQGTGKVILCSAQDGNPRPACIISVTLDRVRLELAGGELLGEWSQG